MNAADFVKYLVEPILSFPNDLQVEQKEAGVLVKVKQEDMGKVIGKGGVTINALRNLVQSFCLFHKLPFFNVVVEDQAQLAS